MKNIINLSTTNLSTNKNYKEPEPVQTCTTSIIEEAGRAPGRDIIFAPEWALEQFRMVAWENYAQEQIRRMQKLATLACSYF